MPHAESPEPIPDLNAPCEQDVIREVRLGKMKNMPGLDVQSAIDKTLHHGPIWVGELGLKGDEHDPTFHGGIDKAVHGYCSSHYPAWQSEYPSAAERFVPGGFGENLVMSHMNERNVCIGDVYAIGSGEQPLLLEVSLPRQPCFKLNHRFRLKNFAPNTWRLSRTGWYYRVLREGPLQAGDNIRLHERRWPDATIANVQKYLYKETDNEEANASFAAIEALGEETRGSFRKRVEKAKVKIEKEKAQKWSEYRVVEKNRETSRIMSFVFDSVVPDEEAEKRRFRGGHVKLRLKNDLIRAYSVVSGTEARFQLGISLADESRGGSKYLHENVMVGDTVEIGPIIEAQYANTAASNHVFVAGGVGITAFLGMMEAMVAINFSVDFHYAVRTSDDIPFRERLEKLGSRVKIYNKSKGERLNIESIITSMPWNSQLYFCGPQRLMDDAAAKTKQLGIPAGEVHFEAFSADVGGDPFEVTVASDDVTLKVGEDETLLEVLKKKYEDIPFSCEVGNCGTCQVKVLAGEIDHRGSFLSDEDKKTSMLSCVSRGRGKITIDF